MPRKSDRDMSEWAKNPAYQRTVTKGAMMPPKKSNKYHAIMARANPDIYPEIAGRSFHSRGEKNRATNLILLQRAGQIRHLTFQPQLLLTESEIKYRPDFYYQERLLVGGWRTIWEDFKGTETERYKIILALWKHYGPGILREVEGSASKGFHVRREIMSRKAI